MSMTHVLNWNGKDVPAELRKLRPGRYVLEEVDQPPELTAEEEDGLIAALASFKAGRGVPAEQVHAKVKAIISEAKQKVKANGRRR